MLSESTRLQAALEQWRDVLGASQVRLDHAGIAHLQHDTMHSPAYAQAVIAPLSSEQVAACVVIAQRHRIALHPISTGHNWGYGCAATGREHCVVMDLSGMARILSFDEELSVVTLEPGVTQGALAQYLQERDLPYLTPVTGAGPSCSLLGNALERGYGITPQTDHFQAVLALEAVLPDGQIYRSPLALGAASPCFKWGVGPYLDGLFSQSGLGIVTQMSLALVRKPQVIQPFYFWIEDPARLGAALEGVRRIIDQAQGQVGGINLMNRTRLLTMASEGQGIAGLPREQLRQSADSLGLPAWMGVGSIYCHADQLPSLKRMIRRELKGFASRSMFKTRRQLSLAHGLLQRLPGSWARRWQRTLEKMLLGVELMEGRPNEVALPLAYSAGAKPPPGPGLNPARDHCGLIWYAPVLPFKKQLIEDFLHAMSEQCQAQDMLCPITLTTLSTRAIDCTVPLLFARNDPLASARAHDCYRQLFQLGKAQGIVPYRVPVAFMPLLADQEHPAWQLGARLKHALDPHHLLSPGRYCLPVDTRAPLATPEPVACHE